MVCVVDISVQANPAITGHANHSLLYVCETAVALSIDTLREVHLPPQAVGHREFRRDAPRILAVKEPTLLALGSMQAAADETLKGSHVTQQERCEAIAAHAPIGRVSRIDVQQPGAAGVARHAQVQRITDVSTELDLVIALGSGPVINKLNLLFAFR